MTTELPDGFMVSLTAGSRIAGYRLEERIGRGGMAVVFRAHDERLDRPVALKILAPTLAGDHEFQQRFIRESRAAATIDDPYIVPVFAAGEANGMLYIAMRYVAGGDARSLLNREGSLPPDRVAAIISSVASALDAAHRAGLVHRDVKPSNMLMDVLPGRPDHVYLSDFGLSKVVASTSGVTAAGAVLGTLAYMSPEQIGAKPVDGRADQYALACSAFELLAGAPPFPGDEPAAVMFAHLSGSPPPLTSRRPGLPPAVNQVLSRALAKAPEDRYASCGQFADALRDALGFPPYRSDPGARPAQTHPPTEIVWPEARSAAATAGASATATTIYVPPGGDSGATRPRRRPWRRIVIAALVVIMAAGLTAVLLPASPAPAPSPAITVPISLKSAQTEGGYVYVIYTGGNQANADVYGDIKKAAAGEVARLYAQQFPYKKAAARVASVTVHPAGGTARYEFQVTPTLATRYRVELFHSSTSSRPFAISGTETVYVGLGYGQMGDGSRTCSRPVCYETVQQTIYAPPSALQTEMAKPVYLYFGLNLATTKAAPPTPQWLSLGLGDGIDLSEHRVSADEFSLTATFTFGVGHKAYHWGWISCTKDSEAEDGMGLPGHHGCGDQRVLYLANYLG